MEPGGHQGPPLQGARPAVTDLVQRAAGVAGASPRSQGSLTVMEQAGRSFAPAGMPPAKLFGRLCRGMSLDYAVSSDPEASKRRSTRIVQSIPITVSAEDALGQPFKERTSTLIINCHGCKFLSRHYILKDTEVTLEVLHPEPGNEPRRVQARVTWVQTPRTGHELFQIGIQLETPGNIWGVAFPPQDWFPYPELEAPSIPAPAASATNQTAVLRPAASEPRPITQIGTPIPISSVPAATQPVSGQADAALRNAATKILAEQAIPIFRDMRERLNTAAEKALEEAVRSYSHQLIRRAVDQIEEARQQNLAALQGEWKAALDEGLQQARQQATTVVAEATTTARTAFARQMATELARAIGQMETTATRVQEMERSVEQQLADAQGRLAEMQRGFDSTAAGVSSNAQVEISKLSDAARQVVAELQQTLSAVVEDAGAHFVERRERVASTIESAQTADLDRQHQIHESAQWLREQAGSIQAEAEARLEQLQMDSRAVARTVAAEAVEDLRRQADEALAAASARLAESRSMIQAVADSSLSTVLKQQQSVEESAEQLRRRVHAMLADAEAALAKYRQDSATAAEASHAGLIENTEQRLHQLMEEADTRMAETSTQIAAAAGSARLLVETRQHELEASALRLQERARSILAETETSMETGRREWREKLESDLTLVGTDWNVMLDTAVQAATARLRENVEELERASVERVTSESAGRLAAQLQSAHSAIEELTQAERNLAEFLRDREEALRELCEQLVRDSAAEVQGQAAQLRQEFESGAQAMRTKWLQELDSMGTDAIHGVFEYFSKAAEWYEKKANTSIAGIADRLVKETSERLRDQAGEVSRLLAGELNHQSLSFAEHTRALFEEARSELTERASVQLEELRASNAAALRTEAEDVARQALAGLQSLEQQAREGIARAADESVEDYNARIAQASRAWVDQTLGVLEGRAQTAIEGFTRTTEQNLSVVLSSTLADFAENLRTRLLGIVPEKTG